MNPFKLTAARKKIALALRERRIAKGFSQKGFAKFSGLQRVTLNRLENGENVFNINTFLIYRDALKRARKKKA